MSGERDYVGRQYASQEGLAIRIRTHQVYTRPRVDFVDWVVNQVKWQGHERVLDVGAGDGQYGRVIGDRCGMYVAADRYLGMLGNLPLADLGVPSVVRVNLESADMPLPDSCVDVVLANHMLYYVEALDRACAGFARVLRPGGRLLATTNSGQYMQELWELHVRVARRFGYYDKLDRLLEGRGFTLENGRAVLERHFERVARFELASELVFLEPEPVVDYLASNGDRLFDLLPAGVSWDEVAAALTQELETQILAEGDFRVSKLAGVFVCQKEMGRR